MFITEKLGAGLPRTMGCLGGMVGCATLPIPVCLFGLYLAFASDAGPITKKSIIGACCVFAGTVILGGAIGYALGFTSGRALLALYPELSNHESQWIISNNKKIQMGVIAGGGVLFATGLL